MPSFDLAEQLHRRLIDDFPPERSYARADVEQAAMPRPVAHFLIFQLRNYAAQAADLRDADWVDASGEEVHRAARHFEHALARHARYPAETWFTALREATDQVVSHLQRPVRTAVRFVFGRDDGELPAPLIVRRLSAFGAFPYLREAVRSYAEQRGVDTMDRTRLTALLTRVEREMTADYDADGWLKALAPLFDLARYAYGDDRGVPAGILATILERADAPSLHRRARVSERERIDEAHLRRLLQPHTALPPPQGDEAATRPTPSYDRARPARHENALRREEPASRRDAPAGPSPSRLPPPPRRPAASEDEAAPPSPSRRSTTDRDATDRDATERDMTERDMTERDMTEQGMTDQDRADRNATDAPADPERPRRPSPAEREEQVPLWRRFRGSDEPERPRPAPESGRPRWKQFRSDDTDDADERSPFEQVELNVLGPEGARERSRFVRELFDGDRSAYEQVLRRLNHVGTWNQASRIIAHEVFRVHHVNIYSATAVAFTNEVEARFRRSAQTHE